MEPLSPNSNNHLPLGGKRIVFTAIDLEQSEHRGIAVYSKALIQSLKEAGAEVWLLTQFDAPKIDSNLKLLPRETRSIIQSSKVLNSLITGEAPKEALWIESKIHFIARINHIIRYLSDLLEYFKRPRKYKKHQLHQIKLKKLFDNPNLRNERLGYLKDVEGLICARKIFQSSQIAALMKKHKSVSIDLSGFDALITSCPLNIKPLNVKIFAQTIHDLIALEYVPHNENTLLFSHRLQTCIAARRIYVSNSTYKKFHRLILSPTNQSQHQKNIGFRENREAIFVQPPSLKLTNSLEENNDSESDIPPVSYLLKESKTKKNLKKKQKDITLQPFNYLLFNSSVEARKNLLFLVKAYSESGLGNQAIKLCVTGKLKKDSYSEEIKSIVKHEAGIILTGYIDERTKTDLYLNAIALLSPSLVEGFGIPALDAACLGLAALVSDCESHREIQAMYDFDQYVLTSNTLYTYEWANYMRSLAEKAKDNHNQPIQERKFRIKRYKEKSAILRETFQKNLIDLLT